MNTFAQASDEYASSRPHYPDELFAWLADMSPRRETAWDCATGSGQAAVGIAAYFESVDATDASAEQIAHAQTKSNVRYSACAAEKTAFPHRRFDLVTVAQALHWFDYDTFWPEVIRVARTDGFFCAWGYDWFGADPDLEQRVLRRWRDLLLPYWASNNGILWRGYTVAEVRPPFVPVAAPTFAITLTWELRKILAYMRTWSAYKKADRSTQAELEIIAEEGLAHFGTSKAFALRMPLKTLAGYIDSNRG